MWISAMIPIKWYGNKGADGAMTAIEMANLLRQI